MGIPAKTGRKFYKILFVIAVLAAMGMAERTAMADPLVFGNVRAFQNDDTTQVDLYSNPGVTLLGTTLTFAVDITGTLGMGGIDVLRITYQELGGSPIVQDFQIPLFGSVNPPLTLIFSFVSPGSNPFGTPATLSLDLLHSSPDFQVPLGQAVNSYTYSFNVQPVPEPATIFALATGLAALGYRRRRRNMSKVRL